MSGEVLEGVKMISLGRAEIRDVNMVRRRRGSSKVLLRGVRRMIGRCVPPHFSSTAVGMGSEEGDGKRGHISIHLPPSPLLYGEHRGGGGPQRKACEI